LDYQCADCREVDGAEADKKLEEEKNALPGVLVEVSKTTEDEYWKKAIDDFSCMRRSRDE
jgi:hypothetical protein